MHHRYAFNYAVGAVMDAQTFLEQARLFLAEAKASLNAIRVLYGARPPGNVGFIRSDD